MSDTYAYDNHLPCLNPSCRSHGRPHPNCRCYSGGEPPGSNMAEGGEVHFCASNRLHHESCEYFKDGGEIAEANAAPQADPHTTLGHAAVHHGLHGLLTKVGKAPIAKSDKNDKLLTEMRQQDPEGPSTMGKRLGGYLATGDHTQAAAHMQNHPLAGRVAKDNLTTIMSNLAKPMLENEPNSEALRSSVDYLHSAIQGHHGLDNRMEHVFNNKSHIKSEEKDTGGLKKFLNEAEINPDSVLDTAGQLGHYLPDHAANVGALAATAINYFKTLKPVKTQNSPLDKPSPIDKGAEAAYERQLHIAQNPLALLQHAKNGTLMPQDLTTVNTLYPGLSKSILDKANNMLIESKSGGKELTYVQRQGISRLMGQPLDSTLTPASAQAIMNANRPSEQAPPAGGKPRAAAVAAKATEKVATLYQTPLQRRATDRK